MSLSAFGFFVRSSIQLVLLKPTALHTRGFKAPALSLGKSERPKNSSRPPPFPGSARHRRAPKSHPLPKRYLGQGPKGSPLETGLFGINATYCTTPCRDIAWSGSFGTCWQEVRSGVSQKNLGCFSWKLKKAFGSIFQQPAEGHPTSTQNPKPTNKPTNNQHPNPKPQTNKPTQANPNPKPTNQPKPTRTPNPKLRKLEPYLSPKSPLYF